MPLVAHTNTFYPLTKDTLHDIFMEHIGFGEDYWCSSDALPQWIDEEPAPEGQAKVIDKDGNINLDPCRIISIKDLVKTQIEVPLTIYEEWVDAFIKVIR